VKFLLCLSVLFGAVRGVAQGLTIQSGEVRTHLIELFSSEGCSSCPPADAWLGALRGSDGLWTNFVPVAFHVDYWDGLGWKDRFAAVPYSRRERAYMRAWGAKTVYTPCFVLDGIEWYPRSVPKRGTARKGVLAVQLDGHWAHVTFQPVSDVDTARRVWLAPLSGRLTSVVKAGENAGRTLAHDFVVLALCTGKMTYTNGVWTATRNLPRTTQVPEALAAWVTRKGSLVPEQVAGGWLRRPRR